MPEEEKKPEFDQYYPGGVMKQMADLAGVEIQFSQYVPGGAIEQLRAATAPDIELDQHGPGGPHGQIGYEIIGAPLEPPVAAPGPAPTSAGITAHDAVSVAFDLTLDSAYVPAAGDFVAMCDKAPVDVDTVAVTATQVDLTFIEDLPVAMTAMAVSYTPGAVPLQGKDGGKVVAFIDFPVDMP